MRKRVHLVYTCLVNQFYPDIGLDVVNYLNKNDIDVEIPEMQICCGQPLYNTGFHQDAKKVAEYMIDILYPTDEPILIISGSCTNTIRNHYKQLFTTNDLLKYKQLENVINRCVEYTEYILPLMQMKNLEPYWKDSISAVFHPSCHWYRYINNYGSLKIQLNRIKNINWHEFTDSTECCGFGGIFSIKHPDISCKMMEKKLQSICNVNPDMIVSADIGCLLHLESGMHRLHIDIPIYHLSKIINECF